VHLAVCWEEMEIKGDKVGRETEMVRETRGEGDI
jgi:hypothetical protein